MLLRKKTLVDRFLAFAFALVARRVVAQRSEYGAGASLTPPQQTSTPPPPTSNLTPYQTDPVPDKQVQKGTVYYTRRGSDFQMAAHIDQENDKPVPKI